MSGGPSSAADMGAFNQRNLQRAQYGTRFGPMRGKGFEREKLATEADIKKKELEARKRIQEMVNAGNMNVQGARNAGDLAVQGARNVGALDERKLMEGGQSSRLDKQVGASREIDLLRYGKGGLEQQKLDILKNQPKVPTIQKLARDDMMGEDAFMPTQNPATGQWGLQKLNKSPEVPMNVSPEQEKKKKKLWEAMSPEEKSYWQQMIQGNQ